jgi:hypothetical protein
MEEIQASVSRTRKEALISDMSLIMMTFHFSAQSLQTSKYHHLERKLASALCSKGQNTKKLTKSSFDFSAVFPNSQLYEGAAIRPGYK